MSRVRAYRFDRFVVDLDRMALIAAGAEVPLRPKAFDTLRTLTLHAGQAVTKDELVAAVWPDVFVNDDALAQCVRDVRKALGDEAQRILRTVPRRGYMLAANVKHFRLLQFRRSEDVAFMSDHLRAAGLP